MKVTIKKNYIGLLILVQAVLTAFFGYYLNRANFPELLTLYSALFSTYFILIKLYEGSQKNFFYGGLLLRVILIFSIPNLSQDFYRFIWDGRMLLHNYNPYLYLPSTIINDAGFHMPEAQQLYNGMGSLSAGHYSNYPPVNQFCFAIAALFAGKSIFVSVIVFKLLIIGADLGTFYFGRKLLKQHNLPENNIFLYFLNPLVIIELTGNLHFEGVMVFFLIWSLYLLQTGRLKWAALVFALSVSVKLVPLMLLPLLFRKLKFKNAVLFYSIVAASTLLLFLPFLSDHLLYNYSATVALWFVNFEFNASIYYLLREIGYQFTGYNLIHFIGKIAPILILSFIAVIASVKKNELFNGYSESMLFALCFYFFLSTTVHPWYIITPLALSIFTNYRFLLVWSFSAILSYYAYSNSTFKENPVLLVLEYAIIFGVLFWELSGRKSFFQNSTLYAVRKQP